MVVSAQRQPDEYIEQWLAALVESLDDAVMSKDLNSTIMSWNRGAENLFGYTADEVVGKSVTLLTPPGRTNEEPEILERIKRGESVGLYETLRLHKNGTPIEISLKVSPIKMRSGEVVGASTIMHDITERKRVQERQDLLVREMSHRVSNVLAVANGLVALSASSATDPKEMARAIQERLAAYMRAHELTHPGFMGVDSAESQSTTLQKLIAVVVAPYTGRAPYDVNRCVEIEGEDIVLNGPAVTGLALVLHEFTTNAAKYGALSSTNGKVHLLCTRTDDDFVVTWSESGGPPLASQPKTLGFGSVLAQRTVKGQFGGELTYLWEAAGLIIRMRLPLARLS
jgi:PAS domain S-box-containing protein